MNEKKLKGHRKNIFSMIKKSDFPLTAKTIYSNLNEEADLSTVYRALEYLVNNHFINSMYFFDNIRLYYYSTSRNSHFIYCTECSKIEKFEDCIVGDFDKKIEKEYKYKIKNHFLCFTGLCNTCFKEKKE